MPNRSESLPVITLTANLVAETTYDVSDWAPGQTRRATNERFQVGGKGINVTKMLQRLEADTTALCFPGGAFGPMCEQWLAENGIPYKAFPQGCITRSGSVIRAPGKQELSILGLDSEVSELSLKECIDWLSSITSPFVLAVCGAIPNWERSTWDAFRSWLPSRNPSVKLAIDTYGPALQWLAQQAPDVIKINRDELALLLPHQTSPTEELIEHASERFPCPLWIITDGEKPLWYRSSQTPPASICPPTVECQSPTGCGDVFFATLLAQIYGKGDATLEKAITQAIDYASRNAASEGIADFDLVPSH